MFPLFQHFPHQLRATTILHWMATPQHDEDIKQQFSFFVLPADVYLFSFHLYHGNVFIPNKPYTVKLLRQDIMSGVGVARVGENTVAMVECGASKLHVLRTSDGAVLQSIKSSLRYPNRVSSYGPDRVFITDSGKCRVCIVNWKTGVIETAWDVRGRLPGLHSLHLTGVAYIPHLHSVAISGHFGLLITSCQLDDRFLCGTFGTIDLIAADMTLLNDPDDEATATNPSALLACAVQGKIKIVQWNASDGTFLCLQEIAIPEMEVMGKYSTLCVASFADNLLCAACERSHRLFFINWLTGMVEHVVLPECVPYGPNGVCTNPLGYALEEPSGVCVVGGDLIVVSKKTFSLLKFETTC
eukprot:PhF_6_TR9750/c0_g1_i3/m.15023